MNRISPNDLPKPTEELEDVTAEDTEANKDQKEGERLHEDKFPWDDSLIQSNPFSAVQDDDYEDDDVVLDVETPDPREGVQ